MIRRIIYFVLFLTTVFLNYSPAQNFYPVSINDEFQIRDWTFYADNYSTWTHDLYPHFTITDSINFNGMTFLQYGDKYLSYDSLNQKLFIFLNGESRLAVDFTLPEDSTMVLYYQGYPRIWKSNGINNESILGETHQVYSMEADTSFWSGYQYYRIWKMKFAVGIGFYQDFYYEWKYDMAGEYTTSNVNTLVFARIDSDSINIYNQDIQLVDPVRNRLLNEFPYYLYVTVTNPLSGLFSNYSSEYNVFRSDTLVFNRTFAIDTSVNLAFVDINHNEIQVGDRIEFKCVVADSSIFSNYCTTPDTGYFTFYVVSDTATSITNESEESLSLELFQNYPNPFNPVTSIQYTVGSKQFVTLKVYNLLGREVAVLVNEEKPAGSYSVKFDGSNLSSGVYFYRMKAGEYTATKKLILLK